MINKTLSQLAADYAEGRLDKETYRNSRGELLHGIVAGHVPVDPIDYLPPLALEEEAAVTEPLSRNTTQIRPIPSGNISAESKSQPTVAEKKSFPAMYIGISIAIVVLLIVGVVMFYPKPPQVQVEQTAIVPTTTETETPSTAISSKAGEELVTKFLDSNTWTEESLNTFLAKWHELSNEEQVAVMKSKRMQRLSSAIYKQFLEEKALATIDSAKALAQQQKLIKFARTIGIQDSRMVIE